MACCVDKSKTETDACCASGEARQNADAPASLLAAAPPLEPIALAVSAIVLLPDDAAVDRESHDPFTSHSDRQVLLSVFLI
jgi:hypothetical protein